MVITFVDGDLRFFAFAQFVADALVNQHVGVDCHAQRQSHGSDARQRQRGLQARQYRKQKQQVGRQGDGGNDAEEAVINNHEDDNHNEAP